MSIFFLYSGVHSLHVLTRIHYHCEVDLSIQTFQVVLVGKEDFESMKLCLEKGNSFRKALKEKEKTLAALQKAVKKLEEELKNC